MSNEIIRKSLKDSGLKQWELAKMMGISEFTLSRKLRSEFSQEEKNRVLGLIRSRKVE